MSHPRRVPLKKKKRGESIKKKKKKGIHTPVGGKEKVR